MTAVEEVGSHRPRTDVVDGRAEREGEDLEVAVEPGEHQAALDGGEDGHGHLAGVAGGVDDPLRLPAREQRRDALLPLPEGRGLVLAPPGLRVDLAAEDPEGAGERPAAVPVQLDERRRPGADVVLPRSRVECGGRGRSSAGCAASTRSSCRSITARTRSDLPSK